MKKLKILLSAIAVITALSATYGTQFSQVDEIEEYEFLGGVCVKRDADCVAPNEEPCTLSETRIMRDNPNSTSCGQPLGKP